jgi:hypothetical protein
LQHASPRVAELQRDTRFDAGAYGRKLCAEKRFVYDSARKLTRKQVRLIAEKCLFSGTEFGPPSALIRLSLSTKKFHHSLGVRNEKFLAGQNPRRNRSAGC